MKTAASDPSELSKRLAAAFVLAVVGVLIMTSRVTPGSAALQERIFENTILLYLKVFEALCQPGPYD